MTPVDSSFCRAMGAMICTLSGKSVRSFWVVESHSSIPKLALCAQRSFRWQKTELLTGKVLQHAKQLLLPSVSCQTMMCTT